MVPTPHARAYGPRSQVRAPRVAFYLTVVPFFLLVFALPAAGSAPSLIVVDAPTFVVGPPAEGSYGPTAAIEVSV